MADEAQNQETSAEAATGAAAEPASLGAAVDAALGYSEAGAKNGDTTAVADAAPGDGDKAGADELQGEQATGDKPAGDQSAKVEAKPSAADAVQMPEGLSEKGQARFRQLTDIIKSKEAELEKLTASSAQFAEHAEIVKGFNTVFEEAKCRPDQFELAMGFIGAVNRGDFATAEKVLAEQTRLLSLATGREIGAPDPLADFPDLGAAVKEQQITTAHALELARARMAESARRQQQDRASQQQQQTETQQRTIQQGAAEVEKWSKQKASTDIDWPAKEALLDKEIEWLAQNVHPMKWVAHLEKFYGMLPAAAPARQTPASRPLRANGGAGGAKAQPGSMLEAIDQQLGYAHA